MHSGGGRQNMLPKPATDGLAISYDYTSPQHYHPANHSQAKGNMGWESNEIPIPRDVTRKPFVKAYDAETDTSTRLDSVLDAYTNMYSDYLDDPEEDEDDEPVEVELSHQRREPWDTRGKNGLYGGGGRGADDRETGWVREYALADDQGHGHGQGQGGRSDDDDEGDASTPRIRRDDFEPSYGNERRRSSSDSAYDQDPPSNGGYDRGYEPDVYNSRTLPTSQQHQPPRPSRDNSFRNAPPRPSSRDEVPPRTSSRPRSKSNSRSANSTPTGDRERPSMPPRSNTQTSSGHKSSSSTTSLSFISDSSARLKKKNASGQPMPNLPTITTPFNPALSAVDGADNPSAEMKRKKSSGPSFKFGRSKKAPVISAPILPDGFVESLGMETFALTPGCSAPSHANPPPPSKKKEKEAAPAPRPRKVITPPHMTHHAKAPSTNTLSKTPKTPTHNHSMSYGGTPEVIRTPLDALRGTSHSTNDYREELRHPVSVAQTPNDFREDINDAFRRLSHDSTASGYAPTISAAQAEQGRRQYFDNLRSERSKEKSEVQAGRGAAPLPQTKGNTVYPTSHRDQGPPSRPHNPPPASSGRYSDHPNGYSSYDDEDGYQVEALDSARPLRQDQSYTSPGGYSGLDSPSGLDSGSDYEPSSLPRGGGTSNWDHIRSQSGGYSSRGGDNAGSRRPSDQEKSEAGDLVWGALSPAPSQAADPQASPFQAMSGSNLFRNPFEMQQAGGGGGGSRRPGW